MKCLFTHARNRESLYNYYDSNSFVNSILIKSVVFCGKCMSIDFLNYKSTFLFVN